ncbi:hypothetical protein AAG570_009088 [Ranatra chinensis]|uniref:Cytochrome P450 n=1 Tax=Ranatra chinensis TaxID=642074 RepID=A0ABD0Z5L6_9HEMI
MMNSSSKVFVNDNDIREEVDTFMFEGHDTTTSAICFIACLLAKHPNVQDNIIDEINQLGIKPSEITYQNLMEAKYLERVIKESLRLYPSVPFVARHIKQDVKVHTGDYVLPAGSTVILSSYFIHRHSDYYKNPEEFNPDNFLADEVAKSHAYAFIPFSAGPRNCIGQKFAMLELKATIIKLVSRYVIEYAGEEWDVVPKPIFILQSSNGFHIKIKKRHQEAIKC